MPYIKPEQRAMLNEYHPNDVGELNYFIHNEILDYIGDGDLSYIRLNAVIGVLECVKLELYRRLISLYEDKKRKENSDLKLYEKIITDNQLSK